MSRTAEYNDQILVSMARTLWLMAYADWVEEQQQALEDDEELDEDVVPYPPPGGDWDDHAPETPLAAVQAAGDLYTLIKTAFDITGSDALGQLFVMAHSLPPAAGDVEQDVDWQSQIKKAVDKGDSVDLSQTAMVYADWLEQQGRTQRAHDVRAQYLSARSKSPEPERFGSVLAHMAVGSGIHWSDDHRGDNAWTKKMPRFECSYYDGDDGGGHLTWNGALREGADKVPFGGGRRHGDQVARLEDREIVGPTDLNATPASSFDERHIKVINPNDKNFYRHSYVMWTSNGGFSTPDYLLIYANSLEDALDEMIDWVVGNRPGRLANEMVEEQYKELEAAFIAEHNREPEDEERWAMMEEAEAATTSGGNAGDRLHSDHWGIALEDPDDRELLLFSGLNTNPTKRNPPKMPKMPASPYDQLATVLFRNTIAARMLRELARVGQMTQGEFMRVYMVKCERPPSASQIREAEMARKGLTYGGHPRPGGPDPDAVATTTPSSFNNNFGRYCRMDNYEWPTPHWTRLEPGNWPGSTYVQHYMNDPGDRSVAATWPAHVIRKTKIPVKGKKATGSLAARARAAGRSVPPPESRFSMLHWGGPTVGDLLAHMSPAKLQWAFENLEYQMLNHRETDDVELDFGWWLERIKPRLVKQNPARTIPTMRKNPADVRKCKAGYDHEALKADQQSWSALKFVGVQEFPEDEDGPEERFELRNCQCGSTLAIELVRKNPPPDLKQITVALAAAKIPLPTGLIINARYITRTDDWYVQTKGGWLWWDSRTRTWKPSTEPR